MKRTDRLYPHFMRLITVEMDSENQWCVSYATDHIEYLPYGEQKEYEDYWKSFSSDDLLDAIRQCYAEFKVDYQDVTQADFEAIYAAQESSNE